jgi:hypothetical protein
MRRSSVYRLPPEVRGRIEALWADGETPLKALLQLAPGITPSALHRHLQRQGLVSERVHVRGLARTLIRLIAEKLRAGDASTLDLLRLAEAIHFLDSVVVSRGVLTKRGGGKRQRSKRYRDGREAA